MEQLLKVNDIFTSISGETCGPGQGCLTTFVRFHGCNLRCYYCDTKMADDDYRDMSLGAVCDEVKKANTSHLLLTGGEPLMQLNETELIYLDEILGKSITVETNGSLAPRVFCNNISYVMDWKLFMRPDIENYEQLRPIDFIKFVCFDMADVQNTLDIIRHNLMGRVLAHPVISLGPKLFYGAYTENILNLVKRYGIQDIIITTQLHKIMGVK